MIEMTCNGRRWMLLLILDCFLLKLVFVCWMEAVGQSLADIRFVWCEMG